jgi:hypothetical protein
MGSGLLFHGVDDPDRRIAGPRFIGLPTGVEEADVA